MEVESPSVCICCGGKQLGRGERGREGEGDGGWIEEREADKGSRQRFSDTETEHHLTDKEKKRKTGLSVRGLEPRRKNDFNVSLKSIFHPN